MLKATQAENTKSRYVTEYIKKKKRFIVRRCTEQYETAFLRIWFRNKKNTQLKWSISWRWYRSQVRYGKLQMKIWYLRVQKHQVVVGTLSKDL